LENQGEGVFLIPRMCLPSGSNIGMGFYSIIFLRWLS